MEGNPMSRRECLTWLARAATFAAAAELCGLSKNACAGESGMVRVADLSNVRNEHATEIARPSLILSRTSAGVAAFSTFCTHRRNRLDVERDGSIVCPVHGSIFDLSGKPVSGPASTPLTWFLTGISDEGGISVDTSKTVKHGQWAELPAWAQPPKRGK